jgi:hypothetical protein
VSASSPTALRVALPPLSATSVGKRAAAAAAVEPKASPPLRSPGRSILSRGMLSSTPRSLRPIGRTRRVELVEEPIVAEAGPPGMATTTRASPPTPVRVNANSRWGPPKTVRVEVPPKSLPPPNAQNVAGAAKNSDWFNGFGNRRNND